MFFFFSFWEEEGSSSFRKMKNGVVVPGRCFGGERNSEGITKSSAKQSGRYLKTRGVGTVRDH
jgi:hypothetical protein